MNGFGDWSQLNTAGASVQSEPAKMGQLTEGAATTIDRVQLSWSALTTLAETGNTFSITSYNLQVYNTATTSWDEVVGETSPFTELTYTHTGLTTGIDYTYRIRA